MPYVPRPPLIRTPKAKKKRMAASRNRKYRREYNRRRRAEELARRLEAGETVDSIVRAPMTPAERKKNEAIKKKVASSTLTVVNKVLAAKRNETGRLTGKGRRAVKLLAARTNRRYGADGLSDYLYEEVTRFDNTSQILYDKKGMCFKAKFWIPMKGFAPYFFLVQLRLYPDARIAYEETQRLHLVGMRLLRRYFLKGKEVDNPTNEEIIRFKKMMRRFRECSALRYRIPCSRFKGFRLLPQMKKH